jgi:glycosyltransferase involved in cell wall biosynthesis
MHLSIIIPTYQAPEYLDLCLHSIFHSDCTYYTFEVIVVVDGYESINREVLDKYKDFIRTEIFNTNFGLAVATNFGVYSAQGEYILVVNDDNVFPFNWQLLISKMKELEQSPLSYTGRHIVLSPNQIEPEPSMFKQFVIKDFGRNVSQFKYQDYQDEALILGQKLSNNRVTETGSTLPFMMTKKSFLLVGGWDVLYSSPHVVDWDFFLKCTELNYVMLRHHDVLFYHFAGASTRRSPEEDAAATAKEIKAHKFAMVKWGTNIKHDPNTNIKFL